ncbi:MAG TPA: DedA family protein [Acetobacteraceae bacterium]|jgi:membrane protein DedA with SNARE-associated domain
MEFIHTHHFVGLLHTYGYTGLALIVGLECLGLPLPGEGALIVSAIYAGSTHNMNPALVVVAAASGAIVGQTLAYWIGVKVGHRLLRQYGDKIGLSWRRLALGRMLFRKHGFNLVIVARFIIVLRVITAMLAGANQMPWRKFIVANVIGSVAWASFYGIGASLLGKQMKHSSGPIGIAVGAAVLLISLLGGWIAHRHQERLAAGQPRRRPRLRNTVL